jgi:hypothetical protein
MIKEILTPVSKKKKRNTYTQQELWDLLLKDKIPSLPSRQNLQNSYE